MDTTDPDISFDGAGRCSHCVTVDRYNERWNPAGDSKALGLLVDRIRSDGKGREYDVIIGLSGGVDSSYLVYQAKQYGLRTLVVHVDTGWNSELAVKNIENIVTRLGFDLVTHVVDWEEMQDVQYAFFKSGVPNQDIPQDHAIGAGFYNFAARYGVKWSFSGSNLACESILPESWGHDAMDLTHIRDIHRRFGRRSLREFPTMSYLVYNFHHQVIRGMNVARPLDLLPYNKATAMGVLKKDLGWRYYGGKHYESRFTKFFQGWYLPAKWGYDKRLAHLSSLVVTGQMTRDQALAEFRTGTLPTEEIESDKDYMAAKLGLGRTEFDDLMRVPNIPHDRYRRTSPDRKRLMGRLGAVVRRVLRS